MKAKLARILYETYCAAVGGKAFNGDALPPWDEFAADEKKKLQSDAWLKVAETVPLALLGDTLFSHRLTAQKAVTLMENNGMTMTGFVLTQLGVAEPGRIAVVDKSACRWLTRDELQDFMHGAPPFQTQVADWKLAIEKLSLAPGDIAIVTVPNEVPLTPAVQAALKKTFGGLLAGKEVRLLLRNADIALENFADLLAAEDLHRILERIDRRKLAEPVAPEQNQTP
jgi:hypothetical protein